MVSHLLTATMEIRRPLAEGLLTLIFRPYDAYLGVDATIRTLVRVHWTRKRLLEWKTSSDADRSAHSDVVGFCRSMIVAPVITIGIPVWLTIQRPDMLVAAGQCSHERR